MPTYQYVCTECGEPTEAVQSFTDAPLMDCPACSGRLRKVFSAVGVVFKGSGFYKNDSRAANGKRAETPDGGTPAGDKAGSGDSAGSGDRAGSGDKPSGDKAGGDKSRGDKGTSGDSGSAPKKESAPVAKSDSGSSSKAVAKTA